MGRDETGANLTQRIWRMVWLLVLVGHGLLALSWWWLSPGGFGFGHPRFWSNRVAPPLVLGLSIASLTALRHDRITALRLLLPAWPTGWCGGSILLRILFPITMARSWAVLLAIAAIMAMAAMPPWRKGGERGWVGGLLMAIGSALAGAGVAGTLRPPASATHPRNIPLASRTLLSDISGRTPPGSVRFGPGTMVQTSDGSLIARIAPLTITVQPLLTFLDRSPDGCPTALVRARDREGPEPQFRDGRQVGEQSCALYYEFRGQGPATLRIDAGPEPGQIALDAATRLERPIDSHLNSFCDVEVRGHHRLFLEFSPCPEARIEVRPFDYPFGRPARFAFVEADRTFRVVEASNSEKGPFRTLARGRLEAEQALTITLHDEERAVARLSLDDYSRAVAGYALSFSEPSAIQTALALRKAIWRKGRPGWQVRGIPGILYSDHGYDFTSRHLEQVAADLKIRLVNSMVGRPRGRGKIEMSVSRRSCGDIDRVSLSPRSRRC